MGEHVTRGRELGLGPRLLYPAKAAATRGRSLAWTARTRGRPETQGLRILFYHRIADGDDELAVSPRRFRAQMEELARSGWRVVDVPTLHDLVRAGEDTGRVVGLSFDDAFLDVGRNAAPILDELGFRATVFVATGVTDGRARFSWYAHQPALLDWDEIAELDGGALGFEAHTITHPNLLTLTDEAARREINGSKTELEARLGRRVRAFCYPAGLFAQRDTQLVVEAGFELAVSCDPGVNARSTDPFNLARIQIDHRDGLIDFRAKVGGAHDRPLPMRAAWRRARYGARASSLA